MNLYQRNPQEYLNSIADKLDRLNKADGRDPKQPKSGGGYGFNDPGYMDPMQWQGQAALEYMKKNPRP